MHKRFDNDFDDFTKHFTNVEGTIFRLWKTVGPHPAHPLGTRPSVLVHRDHSNHCGYTQVRTTLKRRVPERQERPLYP